VLIFNFLPGDKRNISGNGGIRIPDPGPDLSVEQVRDLLTPNYPEIATASVSGPESTGAVLRYTFSRAIGTKG
jgi:PRTRC genetic system protein C